MLIRLLREGLRTLRKAGWAALGLASLRVAALSIILPAPNFLLFVGVTAQNVVTFGLVRFLAARRGIEAKRDGPAQLSRAGVPLPAPRGPGPVDTADTNAWRALRNGGALARSGMRLAIVQLIVVTAISMLVLALGGDRVLTEDGSQAELVRLLAGLVPVAALLTAFVAVAPQRIAIEGDERVILAVAQSMKISRTAYGTLFAVSLLEPLALLVYVAIGGSLALQIAGLLLFPVLHLLVVATLNEVYAEAPALVPPPGTRAA